MHAYHELKQGKMRNRREKKAICLEEMQVYAAPIGPSQTSISQ